MTIQYTIWWVFLAMFWVGLMYIYGVLWFVLLVVTLFFYSVIAFFFMYCLKKILGKWSLGFKSFFKKFIWSVWISIFVILWMIWSFSYYQNELSPAKMPTYTLSNGTKTVIFQTMSHIGTENFYSSVKENIKKAKQKWYVLYYEWVQPGKPENMEKFNQLLWVEFDDELYKNFSKLYWLVAQDNNALLWLENNQDFNTDLSIDQVISIYESKFPDKKISERWVVQISQEINDVLDTINEKQLKILIYINQSIMNAIIKNDWIREKILSFSWNSNIFDVILEDRNSYLVSKILNGWHDQIVVIYGLMHFSGVLQQLQEIDSNWKIIDTQYLYPIQ